MPDDYATAWAKADEEYAARERERIAALIEATLDTHRWWDGSRTCTCGQVIDGPVRFNHTRHLLEVALELDNVGP